MLYKIGNTRVFRYEAWKRVTGEASNVMAVARKPSGDEVSLVVTELDGGTNPISRGIYEATVTFDQDGEWLVLFDLLVTGKRRPDIAQVTVNTPLIEAIEKIASAMEIDDQLSTTHGPGSWETIGTLPEVESTFSPVNQSGQ